MGEESASSAGGLQAPPPSPLAAAAYNALSVGDAVKKGLGNIGEHARTLQSRYVSRDIKTVQPCGLYLVTCDITRRQLWANASHLACRAVYNVNNEQHEQIH